jgi:hypothetical protein
MARSRRESHHSDGITDQKNLQQTSATKSATSGPGHFTLQLVGEQRYGAAQNARECCNQQLSHS